MERPKSNCTHQMEPQPFNHSLIVIKINRFKHRIQRQLKPLLTLKFVLIQCPLVMSMFVKFYLFLCDFFLFFFVCTTFLFSLLFWCFFLGNIFWKPCFHFNNLFYSTPRQLSQLSRMPMELSRCSKLIRIIQSSRYQMAQQLKFKELLRWVIFFSC